MSNRIIVATLYLATKGKKQIGLLNVSPGVFEAHHSGDEVYLTINLDPSVPKSRKKMSCSIVWTKDKNPFENPPEFPIAVGTPTWMGKLTAGKKTVHYTLIVNYGGITFAEDPDMQINS